jgi:hypothetical protein
MRSGRHRDAPLLFRQALRNIDVQKVGDGIALTYPHYVKVTEVGCLALPQFNFRDVHIICLVGAQAQLGPYF